jgi:hypothetical protein
MELVDNLEAMMRQRLLTQLQVRAHDPEISAPLRELVTIYGAWQARLIAAHPRRVHVARELDVATSPDPRALKGLMKKIELGEDLTAYLSSRVQNRLGRRTAGRRVKRDRDRLLAEWGIHHLHVCPETSGGKGRSGRNRDVLLAIFRPADAYLIGFYPHPADGGNWAAQAILETVVHNWPEAGLVAFSEVAVGLTQEYSDTKRAALRAGGVNSAVVIDDRVAFARAQTLDGTPFDAARHAMVVVAILDDVRNDPHEYLRRSLQALDQPARDAAAGGKWRPHVADNAFGFMRGALFLRIGTLCADPPSRNVT